MTTSVRKVRRVLQRVFIVSAIRGVAGETVGPGPKVGGGKRREGQNDREREREKTKKGQGEIERERGGEGATPKFSGRHACGDNGTFFSDKCFSRVFCTRSPSLCHRSSGLQHATAPSSGRKAQWLGQEEEGKGGKRNRDEEKGSERKGEKLIIVVLLRLWEYPHTRAFTGHIFDEIPCQAGSLELGRVGFRKPKRKTGETTANTHTHTHTRETNAKPAI